jgi:hypothetical protein
MFELCFLLAHWQRWNLTSLIFIPLDLVGLVASLWLILRAIKGILNPSEVSRNRAARGRASQHASEPQLLTALLAKKWEARGTGPRLAPDSMSGFSRNRQFDRLS